MFSLSLLDYRYQPSDGDGVVFTLRVPTVDDFEVAREIVSSGGSSVAQTSRALALTLVSVSGLATRSGLPFTLPEDIDERDRFVRSLPAHWFRGLADALTEHSVVTPEEE